MCIFTGLLDVLTSELQGLAKKEKNFLGSHIPSSAKLVILCMILKELMLKQKKMGGAFMILLHNIPHSEKY